MIIAKKIVLHFPQRIVDKPIVSGLIREYLLDINILKASISPGEEGLMIMELSGEKKDYEKGLKYLRDAGVHIQSLSQDVTRNEKRCTHCGACITMCPTHAFWLEEGTRRVIFDNSKCIVCELCVRACPPRAMELHF
ncbi:MAG: 4Fe-4S binding protein [Dehalococcoidia bacterium]|nr:4Fe-4S binding protein [Dehalococcoidia bacterium]